ncbi:MAG: 3-methyladenine DNA glycosylase [Gemmatimonadaceae bacterium]
MPDFPKPTTARAELVLTTAQWQARALTHVQRVQRWTLPRRERRSRRETHPVYDFLFTYYSYSGGKLESWHPDPHESIVDSAEARERFNAPAYQAVNGVIQRNARALTAAEHKLFEQVLHILSTTQDRPANFGCYGMHEWAMVYGGQDVRHAEIAPLRLPQRQVDAFVESRPVACSHFDAFRFFAPAAQPMNRVALEWSTRHEAEQPGCIHANMDLYRWAYTAMPWIGSDLLWECFELAVELRVLDMQAGPYDLSALGFEPVCIETAEGRDEYQQRQREMSARGSVLRARLIDAVADIVEKSRE